MGLMINGTYHTQDPEPDTSLDGEFRRAASTIRNWISNKTDARHPADASRYHLFVAWNCPWAHRTLLARAYLGLTDQISVSYARPRRTDQGWVFDETGDYADPLCGATAVHQIYSHHSTPYTGRITVPVLWDKTRSEIVSNESADIIRMFGRAFDPENLLYPASKSSSIDRWNDLIYPSLNNGVYRAGFARTQAAYDTALTGVFATLDHIEQQLGETEYLTGDTVTEADLRLFPTLARFDVAYHYAFKCNLRRLMDYPKLWHYARRIYAMRGISETVNFDIYKQGYFSPSELRNPLGIVPMGPIIDWSLP